MGHEAVGPHFEPDKIILSYIEVWHVSSQIMLKQCPSCWRWHIWFLTFPFKGPVTTKASIKFYLVICKKQITTVLLAKWITLSSILFGLSLEKQLCSQVQKYTNAHSVEFTVAHFKPRRIYMVQETFWLLETSNNPNLSLSSCTQSSFSIM